MGALAGYACHPEASRGRLHDESRSGTRGPRDIYQRDRDRIIHSISFRRLRSKTQVFIAPDGDHYRVRLTHSLEVAQIGRTIARTLRLNEDLTEALCLAHDIGHPPFGHAGEHAMQAALAEHGGFDHNAHTLRALSVLDKPYIDRPGLNLSWETLEGLAKHNGPVGDPSWALAEVDALHSLELESWPSLEAQIAAVADDIAYDNHDIDDGVRAGLISVEQLCELPFVAERWHRLSGEYPDVSERRLLPELIREQIGAMVNDVVEATSARIAERGIRTVDDFRDADGLIGGFSKDMADNERALKRFMYANLYHHDSQLAAAEAASHVISHLFSAYRDDPNRLPDAWRAKLPVQEPARSRHVADYIAGMTDRYALREYARLFGEAALPGALGNV